MEELTKQTIHTPFKKYIPIVTAIYCSISVALFIGINLEETLDTWDVFRKWGAPSSIDIFSGAYWGLISSNFLHTEIIHISFNLYWLWILGKKVEFESNKVFYSFFILSSALVSSLAELSFSSDTGIGLSGIVYALFGFLFIKSKTTDKYKHYLSKKTINLFIFWLGLCFFLTRTGFWSVANAAHVGGLFWGATIAYIDKFHKYTRWCIGLTYLAGLLILISLSPFSKAYLSYKAHELAKNQKTDEAAAIYRKLIKLDPKDEYAKESLKQLEIHQLQEKAFELHSNRNYLDARQLYIQILSIDTGNKWAMENLNRLPSD